MKYWRGYLIAGILAVCTWALGQFAAAHTQLVDMVYPYISRIIMDYLANWSAGVDFCLWQTLLLVGIVLSIGSIVLMIVLRWNPIQWGGWVLSIVMLFNLLGTGLYGLNEHAGPLAEDVRLEIHEYSVGSLERAAHYYRDMANLYADKVSRNADGSLRYDSLQELAVTAANGFEHLTYDYGYPVFSGSTVPVKELTWADSYEGETGTTVALTGESAVNPNVPAVGQPYAICHEMSHRMCIFNDTDANFAAFLACTANEDAQYLYSGYLMAFRACYNALRNISTNLGKDALNRVMANVDDQVLSDLSDYNTFFGEQANQSDDELCKLLVSWHIKLFPLVDTDEEENKFDPLDETDERLQDIINPTQPEEP